VFRRAAAAAAVLAAAAGVVVSFVAAPASGVTQAAAITITVTAGKPREYAFTLSKTTALTGATVFHVVNRGKVAHSFSIAGQKTPVLKPGKSANLTVVFIDAGTYPFFSAVKGQSRMKGTLHVVEAPSPKSSTSTTPIPVGATEPTVSPPDAPCANPTNTTVTVTTFDFNFSLSQRTIPCGAVTFNITNAGPSAHSFDIESTAANGSHALNGGQIMLSGEKTTQVITFTRTGTFQYRCDLHYDMLGMGGSVAIT
jgi:plastocyanin